MPPTASVDTPDREPELSLRPYPPEKERRRVHGAPALGVHGDGLRPRARHGRFVRPILFRQRKTHEQRAVELEALLSLAFPRLSLFYVLDKLQRFQQSAGKRIGVHHLAQHGAGPDAGVSEDDIVAILARAADDSLVDLERDGKALTASLLPAGARFVREAKAARLAMWEFYPDSRVEEICAIVDIGEEYSEVEYQTSFDLDLDEDDGMNWEYGAILELEFGATGAGELHPSQRYDDAGLVV